MLSPLREGGIVVDAAEWSSLSQLIAAADDVADAPLPTFELRDFEV